MPEAASKMCTRLTNFCWESNLYVLLMYESLFGWLPSTLINNNKNDDVTVVETTTKTWKKGQLQILERSFIIDCQNDAKSIHLSLFDSFLVMHRRQHSEEKLRIRFRYLSLKWFLTRKHVCCTTKIKKQITAKIVLGKTMPWRRPRFFKIKQSF